MKFSVVIPLYNKQAYIVNTLEAVLHQTFQDFEVIVINDGSTDKSLFEAQRVRSEKVKVIDQPNQGVAVARNTGIEHASGEYIAFLDADDLWHADYLETVSELVDCYPMSDIFVTAYQVMLGEGKVNYSKQLTPEQGCLDSYWLTLSDKYDFVWTSATTIRREALINAGLFRRGELIGQDLDMWARVARNNPKVAYSAKQCVDYNRAADQNARNRVKIAYAKAFIHDLEEELENPDHTEAELMAIQRKYDLKMTVYIFTCILAGDKKRAGEVRKSWKGNTCLRNRLLRSGLLAAQIVPLPVDRWAYRIRLKVF